MNILHGRASDEMVNRAIKLPKSLTTDDGRVFPIVTWEARVDVGGPVRIKVEAYVDEESVSESMGPS